MSIIVNGFPIEDGIFRTGEVYVKLTEEHVEKGFIKNDHPIAVTANLYDSDEIMKLFMTVDAIRRIASRVLIYLTIPYVPYARQDKKFAFGESLSLKVFADMINSLNLARVTVYDPHSDVLPALINKCCVKDVVEIMDNNPYMDDLLNPDKNSNVYLVCPDMGATKRVNKVHKMGKFTTPIIYCNKTRTSRDELEIEILGDKKWYEKELRDPGKYNFLVIDDICDGGRTFIEISKKLNVRNHFLYVTHGIFSNGIEELLKWYNKIYYAFPGNREYKTDDNRIINIRNAE